ncbi:MAG: hypothetical protein KF712_04795 [Akkermansiaceae bacterium]|nr:hypothetical protein [Akkermansiaceae bacterium]
MLAIRRLALLSFAGGAYLSQVWLFWVVPILGAVIGAILYIPTSIHGAG